MLVTKGTAEDFIRMFHGWQNETTIAFLILSHRRKEMELLRSLIDGLGEVDHALGEEIGLFLFSPDALEGLEVWNAGATFLGGERFLIDGRKASVATARSFFHPLNYEQHRGYQGQIERAVIQSSLEVVPDFCRIFDISESQLPCICALVRGVDGAIVIKAGERLSYSALVRAAHSVRRDLEEIATRARFLIEGTEGLERAVNMAADANRQVVSKKQRILSLVIGLEQKFGIVLAPQVSAMVAVGTLSPESFDDLIKHVGGIHGPKILADSRTQGVRSAVAKWRDATDQVTAFRTANPIPDLEERALKIERVRAAMQEAVRTAFSEAGISMARFTDYSGSISNLSRVLGVIGKVIGFLRPA